MTETIINGARATATILSSATGIGRRSDRARFADLVEVQLALTDAERWPCRPPLPDMCRCEMGVERGPIAPDFADVDQAGLEHILGIGILDAAILGAAGEQHLGHRRPGAGEVGGG